MAPSPRLFALAFAFSFLFLVALARVSRILLQAGAERSN